MKNSSSGGGAPPINRRYSIDPQIKKFDNFTPKTAPTKQPPIIARIQKQATPKGVNVNEVQKNGQALIKAAPKLAIRRI